MTSVLAEDRLVEVPPGNPGAPRTATPAGEAKTSRQYDQAQSFLLPPSLYDWLTEADEAE